MISEYETEIVSELTTHQVSAWTTDDIAQPARRSRRPVELRPALAPGFGADYLGGVLWERRHSVVKRVAVATELLWGSVRSSKARSSAPLTCGTSPRTQRCYLVDQALRAANATVSADRTTIRAAITELMSSRSAAALYGDDGAGVVIVLPPEIAAQHPAARRSPRISRGNASRCPAGDRDEAGVAFARTTTEATGSAGIHGPTDVEKM